MEHGWRVTGDPHHFYKLPPEAQADALALVLARGADIEASKKKTVSTDAYPSALRPFIEKLQKRGAR